MNTQTKTKTSSKTKVLAATAVILGGIAAYAMATISTSSRVGYQDFYVQCHDGSSYTDNGEEGVMQRHGATTYYQSAICQTTDYWRSSAQRFCEASAPGRSGKQGINTYKVSTRCEVVPHYGFGYGYGYRERDNTTTTEGYGYGYGEKKTTTLNQIKESVSKWFGKKSK